MGGADLVEVEELRNREGLLVTDFLTALSLRFVSTDGQGIAGNFESDILGVNARQRDIDPPLVVVGIDLEGRAGVRGAGRQVRPELVEHTIDFALNLEEVVEWVIGVEHHSKPPDKFLLKNICQKIFGLVKTPKPRCVLVRTVRGVPKLG